MSLLNRMHMAHTEAVLGMAGFWYSSTDEITGAKLGISGSVPVGAGDALGAIAKGQRVMTMFGQGVSVGAGGRGGAMGLTMLGKVAPASFLAGAMSIGSPLYSVYSAYQGYKGNMSERSGYYGLMDAVSQDYGAAIGLGMFAGPTISKTQTVAGTSTPTVKTAGFFRMARIGVGANIGAGIGNAVLGVPGSVIGGVAGAAASSSMIVSGAILAGATVGFGTYSILKSGYRHGRNIRMGNVPHTSGDMSSFFTQNAFTMRSQAVQAMRNSHLNARSALGQEATFMHTNKNYFSTYR